MILLNNSVFFKTGRTDSDLHRLSQSSSRSGRMALNNQTPQAVMATLNQNVSKCKLHLFQVYGFQLPLGPERPHTRVRNL